MNRVKAVLVVLMTVIFGALPTLFVGNAYPQEHPTDGLETHLIYGKEVLAERYTVLEGEWLWKILRKKGLLSRANSSEFMHIFNLLNPAKGNKTQLVTGQVIKLPIHIKPATDASKAGTVPERFAGDPPITYKVKPGDTFFRIIMNHYDIKDEEAYRECMTAVKWLNPSLNDPGVIHAGQIIRLPRRGTQAGGMAAVPVETGETGEKGNQTQRAAAAGIISGLQSIFTHMGEEWIESGDYTLRLKSGGERILSASTLPMLRLRNGGSLVLHAPGKLPEEEIRDLDQTAPGPRILSFSDADHIEGTLERVLESSGYPILRNGAPLEITNPIQTVVQGQWIVDRGDQVDPRIVVINILDDANKSLPEWEVLKGYLDEKGIRVVDFVKASGVRAIKLPPSRDVPPATNGTEIVERLLKYANHAYTKGLEIQFYVREESFRRRVIMADFFLDLGGNDALIDLSDMGTEEKQLLEKSRFHLLSLNSQAQTTDLVTKTLDFLGVQYRDGKHAFGSALAGTPAAISIELPGLLFSSADGGSVLVSTLVVPAKLATFLSMKGIEVLPVISK